MADAKNKKGLGKGLGALLPGLDNPPAAAAEKADSLIPISQLAPNPDQPRKNFDDEKLAELAASLKEHGLVQPLIVVRKADKQYMIVAGERRYRAAKLAGLKELPCLVRELSDTEIKEIALIENIQRENLNAWEEAESYRELQEKVGYTQEQLAARLGKSRPYVANTLRLLSLDEYCAELLKAGQITAGHARALLSIANEYNRRSLAGRIVREQLSVRDTENLAKVQGNTEYKPKKKKLKKQGQYASIEKELRYKLGTKVAIEVKEKGGKLVIDYYSEEDLTRIVEILLPDTEF